MIGSPISRQVADPGPNKPPSWEASLIDEADILTAGEFTDILPA